MALFVKFICSEDTASDLEALNVEISAQVKTPQKHKDVSYS